MNKKHFIGSFYYLIIFFIFIILPVNCFAFDWFLVNAETDKNIQRLEDNAIFNLAKVGKNLNIYANTQKNPAYVQFDLDGKDFNTETVFPYTLAGDNSGNYKPWTPSVGHHTVRATSYNSSNEIIEQQTIRFTITDYDGDVDISFDLINANTDNSISNLRNNDTINLLEVGAKLNIRANVQAQNTSYVQFDLDNRTFNTEKVFPYALAGDDSGNYKPWTPSVGRHTVQATAYNSSNNVIARQTINFLIINEENSSDISFDLINSNTNNSISNLKNNETIDLLEVGTELNIRANVQAQDISYVQFFLDGKLFNTEKFSPYVLAGDDSNDYKSWTPSVGQHIVRATAYDLSDNVIEQKTINFIVIDGDTDGDTDGNQEIIFTLINSNTDVDIFELNNNDKIDLSSVGGALNLRVDIVSQTQVSHVQFDINGEHFNTERTTPYALAGDDNGDYKPWALSNGQHTVYAAAYDLSNNIIVQQTIQFSIESNSEISFDKNRDLISLHHDHCADPDDGHSTAAYKTLTSHYGITPHIVSGTYGHQISDKDYQVGSEDVMQAAWGNDWLNAHNDWSGAVQKTAEVWSKTITSGGHVWIVEGGQSNFTADVVRQLQLTHQPHVTINRIHLIQHSVWNEQNTTAKDLLYVKNNTTYTKIDNGNLKNKTASLFLRYSNNEATINDFIQKAVNDLQHGNMWSTAFNYLDPTTDQGWPEGQKLDFSDTVELLYILGINLNTIANCTDFADLYFDRDEPGPYFPTNSWKSVSPESQNVDESALNNAISYVENNAGGVGADEMIVVRNGYIIYQGESVNRKHTIFSGTKTFTTTVLGLLIKEGAISSINDRAVTYMPNLNNNYPNLTLKHLATFTSGYTANNDPATDMQWGDPRLYLTPEQPMAAPGTLFTYHDPQMHLLGNILTIASNESLEQTFRTRVANIIGMKNWEWHHRGFADNGASSRIVANFLNPSGIYGGGIHATALDIARYGLLYLNKGNWDGQQVLNENWVSQATTNQVPMTVNYKGTDQRGRMGYLWWTNGVGTDGKRRWPSAPPKSYTFVGHTGNYCIVIPEWDMVVVRLTPPGGTSMSSASWETFFSRIRTGIH